MYQLQNGQWALYAGISRDARERNRRHDEAIEKAEGGKHYNDAQNYKSVIKLVVTHIEDPSQLAKDVTSFASEASADDAKVLQKATTYELVDAVMRIDEIITMHVFKTVTFPSLHRVTMAKHIDMAPGSFWPLNTNSEVIVDATFTRAEKLGRKWPEEDWHFCWALVALQGKNLLLRSSFACKDAEVRIVQGDDLDADEGQCHDRMGHLETDRQILYLCFLARGELYDSKRSSCVPSHVFFALNVHAMLVCINISEMGEQQEWNLQGEWCLLFGKTLMPLLVVSCRW